MSSSTYNARSNEITKAGYSALGGCKNPHLYTVVRRNGSHTYTTYHIRGW